MPSVTTVRSAAASVVRLTGAPTAVLATATGLSQRGLSTAAMNRAVELDMPFKGVADRIGDAFGPVLDELSRQKQTEEKPRQEAPLFVPYVPCFLPFAKAARDHPYVREVLVYDPSKARKPRLSWYNPYDTTFVPSGWFQEGLVADYAYYFGSEKELKR